MQSKDLLAMEQLSPEMIYRLLETAGHMERVVRSGNKRTTYLQGKTLVNVFYENSTRTRLSFELAGKYMGAQVANLSMSTSSVQKGENLLDTLQTIRQLAADFIVLRHPMSGSADFVAENCTASIINAGDGMHAHPTQALLDLRTMQVEFGRLDGLKIAILGDVLHSRVARSNATALKRLGSEVYAYSPATLAPREHDGVPIKFCRSASEAVKDADVIMMLRLQLERQRAALFPSVNEYSKFFGLQKEWLELAKPEAIIMHPGPSQRGVEIPSNLHDSIQSRIRDQVTHGIAVRMAILHHLNLYRNQQPIEEREAFYV